MVLDRDYRVQVWNTFMENRSGVVPSEAQLRAALLDRGYVIAGGTITVAMDQGAYSWTFVAVALSRKAMTPLSELSTHLGQLSGVQNFHLAHARN